MYKILIRIKRILKRFLKVRAETRQIQSSRPGSKLMKYLFLILAATLIALIYPAENLFNPLDFPQRGELARKDIIADSRITLTKSDNALSEERQDAIDVIPTIVDYNSGYVDSMLSKFEQFILLAKKAQAKIGKSVSFSDSLSAKFLQYDSSRKEIFSQFPFLTYNAIDTALTIDDLGKAEQIIKKILIDEIYFIGVLSDTSQLPEIHNQSVIIRMGKREVFVTRDHMRGLSEAYLQYLASLNSISLTEAISVDAYYEIGRHFISANLKVNKPEIEARQSAAAGQISAIREVVEVGDVVVRSGQKISQRQEEILKEMFLQERLSSDQYQFKQYLPVMARFILILGIFSLLYFYLYYFHRRIFISNPKILTIFLIYGIELAFIYFIGIKQAMPIYLYPIPIFSIMITVLFDAEIGIFNTIILALLLGVLHRFSFPLVLVTVIVGMVTAYTIQKVSHRTEFFKAILFSAITYTILIITIESFSFADSENLTDLLAFGLVTSVFSPLLAMGFLPIFESLFGFTTNITLLELSDMNNPLLKRLSIEAPGTYHHSLLVGNLAESAAKAINGNSLLARVGAYYHDIGKMEIPEYFVENQLGIKSKHDALTPSMSSIILSSHIKKGRILGELADLPDEILNFIEEHHGTMTMSYFLNKAKEMGEENPSEDEYRYPGPRPRIRETAIVMLADSVEAASRTLNDPKPARIRNLVQNIINDRFESGELEECPLTLHDLASIRESFIQILTGVFHQRIEYPDKEDEKK